MVIEVSASNCPAVLRLVHEQFRHMCNGAATSSKRKRWGNRVSNLSRKSRTLECYPAGAVLQNAVSRRTLCN